MGLGPDRSMPYRQSDIPEVSEPFTPLLRRHPVEGITCTRTHLVQAIPHPSTQQTRLVQHPPASARSSVTETSAVRPVANVWVPRISSAALTRCFAVVADVRDAHQTWPEKRIGSPLVRIRRGARRAIRH